MKKTTMHAIILISLVTLVPLLALAKSTDTLHLDLALNDPGSIKSIQGNRSYKAIILENVVWDYSYSIEIKSTPTLLKPININNPLQVSSSEQDCSDLVVKLNNLKNFQLPQVTGTITRDEKSLGIIVFELETERQKSQCEDAAILESVDKWIGTTKKIHKEKIKIATGDKVTITIKRGALEWVFILNGNERGQWVTTYGFSFSMQRFESQSYFTKPVAATSDFEILKSQRVGWFDFNYVPAIFFSYFPSQNFNKCWNNSLTAGLGFDLSAPVIFIGYNGLFYNNIGFSTGIAFQQQYRLKDQFSVNDIISMPLDINQLHDRVYRPNFYLSINFRFGENPFKS